MLDPSSPQARAPPGPTRTSLGEVRAYADPGLRGRKNGGGDGLERLAVRMFRAGMLRPVRRAPGVKGIRLFTVAKSGESQRLVWDMREANAGFRTPPHFPQGSVSALVDLEVGDPGYVCAAATDVPDFFYALRMPSGFAEFIVLEGVDFEYVRNILQADGYDSSAWPEHADSFGCERLPMGFSWAPLLAQRCLDAFVGETAFADSVELVH